MQLRLPWNAPRTAAPGRTIVVDGERLPVDVHRRKGARRYIVRVSADGRVRLTVPFGATIAGGLSFAEGHAAWIAEELERARASNAPWRPGTRIWFRGERVPIDVVGRQARVTDALVVAVEPGANLRPAIVAALRKLAAAELPDRCVELATMIGRRVPHISVRNQRSRWGACTARGTITLNWRLVQVPLTVRDYVILHEIAHLTVPDHSRRFWREVASLCASWRESEEWLKVHEHQIF